MARRLSRRRRWRLARTAAVLVVVIATAVVVASHRGGPLARPEAAGHTFKAHGPKTGDQGHGSTVPPDTDDADLFSSAPVARYLAAQTDDVTAAVFDDVNGHSSLYRPGVADDTASIMKVDILATLLHQLQGSDASLTSEQQILSQQMIEQSNDDDAQDLWDAEGGADAVRAFDDDAGLTQTDPDQAGYWGLSTTTAADQVQLLKAVAFPNSLLTPTSRQYELGLMTNVDPDQAWGVSTGVGSGAVVAIKDGWLPLDSGGWEINSMGYVHGDGRDYLVAVLTDGNSTEGQGIDTIDGLSRLLWRQLAPSGT